MLHNRCPEQRALREDAGRWGSMTARPICPGFKAHLLCPEKHLVLCLPARVIQLRPHLGPEILQAQPTVGCPRLQEYLSTLQTDCRHQRRAHHTKPLATQATQRAIESPDGAPGFSRDIDLGESFTQFIANSAPWAGSLSSGENAAWGRCGCSSGRPSGAAMGAEEPPTPGAPLRRGRPSGRGREAEAGASAGNAATRADS